MSSPEDGSGQHAARNELFPLISQFAVQTGRCMRYGLEHSCSSDLIVFSPLLSMAHPFEAKCIANSSRGTASSCIVPHSIQLSSNHDLSDLSPLEWHVLHPSTRSPESDQDEVTPRQDSKTIYHGICGATILSKPLIEMHELYSIAV